MRKGKHIIRLLAASLAMALTACRGAGGTKTEAAGKPHF